MKCIHPDMICEHQYHSPRRFSDDILVICQKNKCKYPKDKNQTILKTEEETSW